MEESRVPLGTIAIASEANIFLRQRVLDSLKEKWSRRNKLGPFVPNVPDRVIHRPDLQGFVGARLERCIQLILRRRFFAKPFRQVGFVEDDGHPIVKFTHNPVRSAGDDRAAKNFFATTQRPIYS